MNYFTKTTLLILVLALLSATLVACGLQHQSVPEVAVVPIPDVVVHELFSPSAYLNNTPEVQARGISVGFVWPEHRDEHPSQRPQTVEVSLATSELFAPLLIVQMKEETTALVSVLLDFKQIEFELDGQMGLLHEIRLEPGTELEIPIKVDIADPGTHELAVLVFADPYNGSLDPMYRMSGLSSKVGGRRAIVVVGDRAEVAGVMPPARAGHAIPEDVAFSLVGVMFASSPTSRNSHPVDRQLYVAQGRAGEPFHYQLWVSNQGSNQATEFALVAFQDYHQVLVDDLDVTVARLEADQEAIIDSHVSLPLTPGVSQMQVVYILDPYKSILHEEVTAPFTLATERIAIHVTD
mgnify:CR=1 FL=1